MEASFLVLQGVGKQDALNIALARLVIRRKLQHNAVEWPELRKLLVAVNNTVEPKLQESCSVVLRLIEGSLMEVSKLKEARRGGLFCTTDIYECRVGNDFLALDYPNDPWLLDLGMSTTP